MARVRTYSPKKSEIERGWRVVDAEGETLGRLATRIAAILRGKDKPTYTMHMSVGDNVIVINAEKVRVTGQKEDQKTYYRHTQYPGGLRSVTLSHTPGEAPGAHHSERREGYASAQSAWQAESSPFAHLRRA